MIILDEICYTDRGFTLNAHLEIPQGSKTAILGPSGAGKSTLLHLIAGQLLPDRGRLWIGPQELTNPTGTSSPVSLLFQEHNTFEHLSVAQNLALARLGTLKGQDKQIARVVQRTGLQEYLERKVVALSGGQKARVALAMVLLQRNKVIALDEPFSALGPAQRAEIMMLAVEIANELEATLLIVSHQPEEALSICDLLVWVDEGVVSGPFQVDAITAAPPVWLQNYLGREHI